MERKFSPSRLYKFTKTIVIVVTVISALFAAWEIYQDSAHPFVDDKNYYENICDQMHPQLDNVSVAANESQKADDENCIKKMDAIWDGAIDLKRNSILVAMFLPTIFFVGSWAYKYLFPKSQK